MSLCGLSLGYGVMTASPEDACAWREVIQAFSARFVTSADDGLAEGPTWRILGSSRRSPRSNSSVISFDKENGDGSTAVEALWQRLQRTRHGDIGGAAHLSLSPEETRAVIRAADIVLQHAELDESEAALIWRLSSVLE